MSLTPVGTIGGRSAARTGTTSTPSTYRAIAMPMNGRIDQEAASATGRSESWEARAEET